MDRFTSIVTNNAMKIVVITFALMVLCALLAFIVPVNYNLVSYLPESSESTQAIDIMNDEFDSPTPNARVMIDDISLDQALSYKQQLEEAPGVEMVMWLDDVTDLNVPLGAIDSALVDQYFKDYDAIYNVVIASGEETAAMNAIYDIIGENGHATGEAVTTAETQALSVREVLNAFAILVPLILALLIISTNSWFEPLFFLLAIGVSIVFNMGTNLFLGEVSYIAFTVSPILQLAVSLDYAIFLLHAFQRAREVTDDPREAMRDAMKDSFSAVAASAATTTFGFAALGFMQFGIGADLGITLVKGIIFSFLCVMIFLPAFTLVAYKLVDRTQHRPFLPSFKSIGKVVSPLRIPALVLVCVLVVPCFLAQSHMNFTYGVGGNNDDMAARTVRDKAAIEEVYEQETPIVILVPRGEMGKEVELTQELEANPLIKTVMSYSSSVGAEIPVGFLDPEITKEFYSDDYGRIVVYANTANEGPEAFGLVEEIRGQVQDLYGDEGFVAGEPASLYDMREVTSVDSRVTNTIAIISILLVLLITFRSLLLPFILIATIESAIIINLSIPYFTGDSLNYLGFLVINTVQLGATVDYAILLTDTFLKKRRTMPVREALFAACGESFKSVLVSASILALAGFVLWVTSSNGVISILGLLLFRGSILSFLLVFTFLPALLRILDKPIAKTMYHARFFQGTAAEASADLDAVIEKEAALGKAGEGTYVTSMPAGGLIPIQTEPGYLEDLSSDESEIGAEEEREPDDLDETEDLNETEDPDEMGKVTEESAEYEDAEEERAFERKLIDEGAIDDDI